MSNERVSDARSIIGRAAKILYSSTNGPQRPLDTLETIQHVEWLLNLAKDELVLGAKAEGYDWAQIGRATGLTRQGARQRWKVRRADPSDEDRRWRKALPPAAGRGERRARPR